MGHKHMASAVYPRLRKEGCFGKMVVIRVMPQYLLIPMVADSALHAQSREFILLGVIDKAPISFHLFLPAPCSQRTVASALPVFSFLTVPLSSQIEVL